MAAPPSDGADHDSVTWALPGVATTLVGAPGGTAVVVDDSVTVTSLEASLGILSGGGVAVHPQGPHPEGVGSAGEAGDAIRPGVSVARSGWRYVSSLP